MNEFQNRQEAGQRLARELAGTADQDAIVLALPRGGVPVGYEVAKALRAPLDVFLVRKLGVPGHEELAMGAIATGGVRVINEQVRRSLPISDDQVDVVASREQTELERRERAYRGDRPAAELGGRTAILVDDGLATGSSMRAAVQAVRSRDPARIVVAVPTAPRTTLEDFRREVDDVVCVATPDPFIAVGGSYVEFSQTSDDEVRELLAAADRELPSPRKGEEE
jgi:predicted phosphoribosyltransferase